jgi:1,4-alpha-glucan branching enzyme
MLPKNLSVVSEDRLYEISSVPDYQEPSSDFEGKEIEYYAEVVSYVDIVGTFTDWKTTRMKEEGGGRWTFLIEKTGTHYFKFIVESNWKSSDIYPTAGPDGNN